MATPAETLIRSCETCFYRLCSASGWPCGSCSFTSLWRPAAGREEVKEEEDSPLSPSHYSRFPIQPLDFIERNGLSFLEGNVIKYVLRAPYKGRRTEDLRKARVYLNRLIARAEAGQEK